MQISENAQKQKFTGDALIGIHNVRTKASQANQCAFLASYGWFIKFKIRYGIKVKKMHGEKLSAERTHVESFKAKLAELMASQEVSLDELYNADESVLYFKMLPCKTIVLNSKKKLDGAKAMKCRFTFMPCANVTGFHKLDLKIIGTATI